MYTDLEIVNALKKVNVWDTINIPEEEGEEDDEQTALKDDPNYQKMMEDPKMKKMLTDERKKVASIQSIEDKVQESNLSPRNDFQFQGLEAKIVNEKETTGGAFTDQLKELKLFNNKEDDNKKGGAFEQLDYEPETLQDVKGKYQLGGTLDEIPDASKKQESQPMAMKADEMEKSQTTKKLNMVIDNGGVNLSIGQKQLIYFAKAVMRKPMILLMDEATAAIDEKNDMHLQKIVKEEFAQATVITIAHRQNTIITYDKLLVLKEGEIEEYGTPYDLLRKKGGLFKSMVEENGQAYYDDLTKKCGEPTKK